MKINDYKEILNIASSFWMSKGITGLEFSEKLVLEKDIAPFIVHEKYNSSAIGTTLTHSVLGYELAFIYHKNILHKCCFFDLISAEHIQKYVDTKITEHQLMGIENICNLYQAFVQTLLIAGIELKINNYANNIESFRDMVGGVDLFQKRRIGNQDIGGDAKITFNDTDIC